ncbi:MAG: hypothetical protein JRJ11_15930 [Deltaproteobacteria bacterium]|nr:hypothetical protein [Deltaproteobacteria bacterium]
MQNTSISISSSAKKFVEERGIKDVTFNLKVMEPAGCSLGIVKEIEPVYEAVEEASNYRYFQVEGIHVFVSREIKILGPLTITTEGLWKIKRLALRGATIPL